MLTRRRRLDLYDVEKASRVCFVEGKDGWISIGDDAYFSVLPIWSETGVVLNTAFECTWQGFVMKCAWTY